MCVSRQPVHALELRLIGNGALAVALVAAAQPQQVRDGVLGVAQGPPRSAALPMALSLSTMKNREPFSPTSPKRRL